MNSEVTDVAVKGDLLNLSENLKQIQAVFIKGEVLELA